MRQRSSQALRDGAIHGGFARKLLAPTCVLSPAFTLLISAARTWISPAYEDAMHMFLTLLLSGGGNRSRTCCSSTASSS
jgi:hypothetical protein